MIASVYLVDGTKKVLKDLKSFHYDLDKNLVLLDGLKKIVVPEEKLRSLIYE